MQTKGVEHKPDFLLNLLGEHNFSEPYDTAALSIMQNTLSDDYVVWERTFRRVFKWFNVFANREKALKSFSILLSKLDKKEHFLELFFSSYTLRSCLTYIFSYPYLSDILFSNPNFVFFILSSGSGEDESAGSSDKDFYGKEYLLNFLLDFLCVETEEEAIKRVTFKQLLAFKQLHILRISSFNGIGKYSLERLGILLSNLADFTFDFVLKREKFKLSKVADIKLSILALERFALRAVSYTDSYKVLFVYGDYAGTDKFSAANYYSYCKLLVQRVVDFISPRRGEVLYNLSFYKESSRSSYPIIYRSSEYTEHLENSQTILTRYNLLNLRFSAGDSSVANSFIKSVNPLVYHKHFSLMELQGLRSFITNIFSFFDKRPIMTMERMFNLLSLLYIDKLVSDLSGITFLFSSNTLMTSDEKLVIRESYVFLKELKNQRELCNLKDWSFFFDEFDKIEEHQFALDICLSGVDISLDDDIKEKLILRFEDIIYRARDIFRNYIKDFVDSGSYILFLLYHEGEDGGMEEFLESYGFVKPALSISLLREIVPYSARAKESFGEVLSLFFNMISSNKVLGLDVDSSLIYFVKLVQSYNARSTLFDLFIFHPFLFKRLLNIFSNSSFLSEIVINYPEFVEYLSDESFLDRVNSIDSLDIVLKDFLSFLPFKEAIVYLKNLEILRIGVRHILFPGKVKDIGYELSNLAEVILLRSFDYFYNELLVEKSSCKPLDYAIIFLGKLGGRELSFGSDLDIYLVYGDGGGSLSDSGYSESAIFFSDLISRIKAFFSMPSVTGVLYELDLKLRPEGRNAPLTVSFNKMRDYLLSSDEVIWERLVYTKARVFSPSSLFRSRVEELVAGFISSFSAMGDEAVRKEVRVMRDRISSNAIKKSSPFNFFKKGRGGLLDIEFLIEYLVIAHRAELGFSKKSTNLFDMLHDLHKGAIIDDDSYILFKGSLLFFRNIELVLRIKNNTAVEELPLPKTKDFFRLVYRLGFTKDREFLLHYGALTVKLRDIFDNYFS